jgi:alpha-galactosidase
MKWDFNADLGPGGWAPGLPQELVAQDSLVAHYHGLYRLQDQIRAAFPNLTLEMCASGGGRMDGALLAHAHVNWISDQPGSLHKLAIHFGTQLAHPAVACNDWLVEWPPGRIPGYDDDSLAGDMRGDLAFRLRVAMLGSFGISAGIDRWSAADIATAKVHVGLYKDQLRDIIHQGDQYQLTNPPTVHGAGDWAAMWYVSKDGMRGVLFAFRLGGAAVTRIFPLPGLLATQRYRIWSQPGEATEIAGATLAAGLAVTIEAHFASCLCRVEADRSSS